MKNISGFFKCCAALLVLTLSAQAKSADAGVLKVGVVPQFEAQRLYATWQPILDALSESTGLRLELEGSRDIPEFERKLNRGDFDIAYSNPYHLVVANRLQGYLPIARDISRELWGIVVVLKDGPIQSVEDLDGKTIDFPAPNALGASLMTRAAFSNRFQIDYSPRYVNTHSSVYLNVALGQSEAGGGVLRTLNEQPEELRNRLRIIYETDRVAPHPISVHPRLSDAVRTELQSALLGLGATESGQALFQEIPIRRIGTTDFGDYAPLADMGLEPFYQE